LPILLPYFDVHCEAARTYEKRQWQEKQLELMESLCDQVFADYIEYGEVDLESMVKASGK